ncbi:MAG TPA: SMC-Scp complex subunit ScpB [Pseudomonadales bacterium]
MEPDKLKKIIEAALLAADEPLSLDQLAKLFRADEVNEETLRADLRGVLSVLADESAERGYELARVASGSRYQVRQDLAPWISRLWEEKPPRYTRALLETLALVAYKQPVTRGDIEQVRGVSVSQNIMRTLLERGWIRVVGQREVPGRPSMYGTTKEFLDYFNLKSLDQLPPLAEIRALIEPLILEEPDEQMALGDDSGLESSVDGQTRSEMMDSPADADVDDDDDAGNALDIDEFDAELAAALERADAAAERFRAGETAQSAEDAATEEDEQAAWPAQVVDVVTDLDDTDRSIGSESDQAPESAKVLKLPTSSH